MRPTFTPDPPSFFHPGPDNRIEKTGTDTHDLRRAFGTGYPQENPAGRSKAPGSGIGKPQPPCGNRLFGPERRAVRSGPGEE